MTKPKTKQDEFNVWMNDLWRLMLTSPKSTWKSADVSAVLSATLPRGIRNGHLYAWATERYDFSSLHGLGKKLADRLVHERSVAKG